MGIRFFKSASITGGSQFLGTEFSAVSSKPTKTLIVREILLKMGGEVKNYEVRKTIQQSGGPVTLALLAKSGSTDTDVIIKGTDADVALLPGEQIQVFTSGATSSMEARLQYEEIDGSQEPAFNDPKFTRWEEAPMAIIINGVDTDPTSPLSAGGTSIDASTEIEGGGDVFASAESQSDLESEVLSIVSQLEESGVSSLDLEALQTLINGQASLLETIQAALADSLQIVIVSPAENITATELNDGPAGTVKRTIVAQLKTKGGASIVHNWANLEATIVPVENADNGAIGAPTMDNTPIFFKGKLTAPATFDTNGPAGSKNHIPGTAASEILTLTANFSNNDTVTIDTKVYTMQTVLTDVDGNVLIGASASDSIDNLIAAITLGSGSGTLYAASTTLHPTATAAAGAGDTMDATANAVGTAGNSITTTETSGTASWGAATMSGGVDADSFDFPIDLSTAFPLLANVPIVTKIYTVT